MGLFDGLNDPCRFNKDYTPQKKYQSLRLPSEIGFMELLGQMLAYWIIEFATPTHLSA